MKVLFDANTPAPLSRYLRGHTRVRADELGWEALENGALIAAAEQAAFDVLLTCDKNLPHQQNLSGRRISVVVLSTNHSSSVRLAAARISAAIDFAQSGQVVRVEV